MASVADYYAIVIKERSGVDDWLEDWEANGCYSFSITSGPDPICSLVATRAYMVAGALESILRSAQTEEAPGFIGTPPEEIGTVLQSTQASAEEAYAAGQDWTAECPGDLCTNRTLVLTTAMEDLQGELDSWAAYIP